MSFALVLVHLGVGAVWLGWMSYSLFVVGPRVARVLPDPARAEDLYRELGAGNRWRVIGLIATLAASGVGLLFVQSGHSYGWWIAIVAKVAAAGRGLGPVLVGVVAGLAPAGVRAARGTTGGAGAVPQGGDRDDRLVGAAFVLGVAATHLLYATLRAQTTACTPPRRSPARNTQFRTHREPVDTWRTEYCAG